MKDFLVDSSKTPLVPEVNVDPRKNKLRNSKYHEGIIETLRKCIL